ncbi:MAG: 30S ribosomal protein S2 [Candidatus Marinimicrobia bacterium]|nr:30S ribosomal protein S2 [Candidatus Neomarinimicrobiota bacterium]|tara:strand:+ start:173672 stop:174619 length:948 start_codon:yes stop_codon:yes gene_type:complete
MSELKFDDLLKTGAHFGHVTSKWNPYYKPYVLMVKNGVHIINLEETIKNLNIAIQFLQDVVRKKGEVLFVGTKKQAKDIIQQEADRCRMFYVVERWLGGTLTNFSTIKKSIKRLQMLEKEGSSIYDNLTKKEIQMLNRERIKLSDQHRGIKDMRRLPEVIVVVDANHESTVVKEANRLEIPVVAIVDSNTDPRPIDYPIPANDDSIRAIQLIISSLSDGIIAVKNGVKENEENVMELESSSSDEETDNAEFSENIVIKEDIISEKKINVDEIDEDNIEEHVEAIKDDEADSNEESSKEKDSDVSEDKVSANIEEE